MSIASEPLWLIIAAGLVLLLQAGFFCLERGLHGPFPDAPAAGRRVALLAVSLLLFWLAGFGLLAGRSAGGWAGATGFALDLSALPAGFSAFFVFQAFLCLAAVSLLTAALPDSRHFSTLLLAAALLATLIYPLFAHWTRSGLVGGDPGWLARLGFIDRGGAATVHSVAGWSALALLFLLRKGRHGSTGAANPDFNLAALGLLVLLAGWIGFFGGRPQAAGQLPLLAANLLVAGAAGALPPLFAAWRQSTEADLRPAMLGVVAGLIAASGGGDTFSTGGAALAGMGGGLAMLLLQRILDPADPPGLISTLLGGGVWGILAVALFGRPELAATGLDRWTQLLVQLLGAGAAAAWSGGATLVLIGAVHRLLPAIQPQAGPTTGAGALPRPPQSSSGPESATELARLAAHYNKVLAVLNQDVHRSMTIVQKAVYPILTLTRDELRIISFNDAAEKLFAYEEREITGQSIGVLLRTSDDEGIIASDQVLGLFKPLFQRILKTGRPFELIGRRADGLRFPVEITLTENEPGEAGFLIATLRDVTHQHAARVALENANRELSLARDEAVNASRFKGQLLAKVSHELRTPLGAILGYAELLRGGVFGKLQTDQQEVADEIIESTRYLADLVNDLLDQARLESGQLKIAKTPFEVKELFYDVRGATALMASGKELALNFNIDPRLPKIILGDKHRLQQILINLISNAVKFTDEGMIDVHAACADDGRWILRVRDTGQGISPSEQKQIFEPFKQADGSITREFSGTGLGLAIVRQLTDLMGGEVTLKSQVGRGSSFTIWLPIERPAEDEANENSAIENQIDG